MSSSLFSRNDLEQALRLLLDELSEMQSETALYVVGGAAVMVQAGREAMTRDVDTLHIGSADVLRAVARLAERHGWPGDWLNDQANMWASHFDAVDDWELWLHQGEVSIFVAKPRLLLAMKMRAGRGMRDHGDIEQLLQVCEIKLIEEALEVFDRYFPTESIPPRVQRQLEEYFLS